MGVFKKDPKNEYWFVPSTDGGVYGLQNIHESSKKSTAKKVEKPAQSTTQKKSAATKEAAKSATEKTTKKVTKTEATKPTAKKSATAATEKKTAKTVKVTKEAPKKVETKKAEPKKAIAKKATATEKASAKATTKATAKATTKATAKATAKVSVAKKATKPAKKKSEYITLIATEEIPKTLYYDEDESEKIAKDLAGEKIEVSEYPGMFEIKKSKDDRYVFNLYAANHVIIATSQVYSSAKNAQVGINSVITNAERAGIEDQTLKNVIAVPFPKWEIYTDKGGAFRFRLSASNGSCICHSQGYTTKASCKNGIESIIRTVKNVKIDKSYLK